MTDKIKCILCICSIVLFLSLILIKVKFDESSTRTDNHERKANVEQINYGDKLKYQIDYLSQVNVSSQSLLDRKENAVWAAFALYITGLVLFYRHLKKLQKLGCSLKCGISLLLIIIAISVFAFIHAQYSSIYDTKAHARASKILLLRIIDSGEPINNLTNAQDSTYQSELTTEQRYRGDLHPLKIIISFIFGEWTKSGERDLNSTNTQEAAIYFLLLLSNFIYIVLLMWWGEFPHSKEEQKA